MSIYEFIRQVAEDRSVSVLASDVVRIAGTLKCAGFPEAMTERDEEMAVPIVVGHLQRVTPQKRQRTAASTTIAPGKDAFQEIEAMVKQGKCARCNMPTVKVKLANYETANYCEQCRVTLW